MLGTFWMWFNTESCNRKTYYNESWVMTKEVPSVIWNNLSIVVHPNVFCSSHMYERKGYKLQWHFCSRGGSVPTGRGQNQNFHMRNKIEARSTMGFLPAEIWKEWFHVLLAFCIYAGFCNFVFFPLPSVSQRIQSTILNM